WMMAAPSSPVNEASVPTTGTRASRTTARATRWSQTGAVRQVTPLMSGTVVRSLVVFIRPCASTCLRAHLSGQPTSYRVPALRSACNRQLVGGVALDRLSLRLYNQSGEASEREAGYGSRNKSVDDRGFSMAAQTMLDV